VNQLVTTQESPIATASAAMMMNPAHMQALVTFADMMAKSAVTVPKHLQGKPADCLAIAMQAAQWGMNPFAVAQKTHIVNGTLGYEAQLVNAVIQASGAIRGSFHYEYRGDGPNLECRVGAVLNGGTDVTWGEWLRSGDITTKNSPLWKVNPKQQLGYLQVKNWARLFCPGAILGVYTEDELVDIQVPTSKHMGPAEQVNPEDENVAVAPMIAEAIQTKTDAEALAYWKNNNGKLVKQPKDHAELKRVISEHRARLRALAEEAQTIDMPAQAPSQPAAAPQVDDEFVRQMDSANDYVPE
jgi:hypothetical protein